MLHHSIHLPLESNPAFSTSIASGFIDGFALSHGYKQFALLLFLP
jgi:hypothetical protein